MNATTPFRYALLALLLIGGHAHAQSPALSRAELTFRVVDDAGLPVAGATVRAGSEVGVNLNPPGGGFPRSVNEDVETTTNGSGQASLALPSLSGRVGYQISKAGYYAFLNGEQTFQGAADGRWQPVNPVVNVPLPKVVNPVALLARRLEIVIPAPGREFGYDLIEGDWVTPAGRGTTADLLLRVDGYFRNGRDYDSQLTLHFANPGDGLIPVAEPVGSSGNAPARGASVLRLPRIAPESGYEGQRTWRKTRLPGQRSDEWNNGTTAGMNYYFRVRTVVAPNGQIVSAIYGKIYGDLTFGGASQEGCFVRADGLFLNPTSNDRNLEFDPAHNLVAGLKSTEAITRP